MKAIVYSAYGEPEVVALDEVEAPTPGPGEVLIRVHAATVSTTDSTMRKGSPFFARFAMGLSRPRKPVLGTELAGVVEALGQGVTRFEVGDRLWAASGTDFGAHAEYISLPEEGALALSPDNVTFEEAAALCEGSLTALPFLRDLGEVRAGQRVLIIGASGAVGTAAVQLAAHHLGARVTGLCSTKNLDLVASLGAEAVIDYTREDFTRNGERYDVIFDTVGRSSFSACAGSLTEEGRYLSPVLGLPILLAMLRTKVLGRKKALLTFTGLRPEAEKAEDLRLLKELVEAGKLRAVIGGRFSPEQAVEAHRLVESGHKQGNAVLTFAEAA